MRQLKLRMSDESVKVVMVDENQPVANLMVIICTKLGITNHDEYSLIATGAHTINGRRKDKGDRVLDQKMEQLKKKLKTDEDLAWLDHSKTLDENGVSEHDACILRRKFFYSDQNVDSRDPVQLNLLYVQTRDAIISGTHPVTIDGACKFAGIQCQAQLGDFSGGSTLSSINLKDYLPYDYAKIKQIDRKIFAEHKKHYGLSELEAKARYVSEARSLPTYGVTFFLVKEKVSGKSKLVPRLLGVTKDCVMRVDANTKAILKTWPLTTVKRWAASLNSFTLDFGDYSDTYYSVQTSEGEQISQLIAGYIDIILKRKKAKDHFGIDGDEGSTMIEDSVAPSRATIVQHQPMGPRPAASEQSLVSGGAVPPPTVVKQLHEEGPFVEPADYRPATEIKGKAEIGFEPRPPTQYPTSYVLSGKQRQLMERIEAAQYAVDEAQRELDDSAPVSQAQSQVQDLSTAEEEKLRRQLSAQFADINAATAQLVSLSAIPEDELDYPALNKAVETVAHQLPRVAKDVKIVAALMQDDESAERLVDAARKLCHAFSDLLSAAEPGPPVARQSLISAASRVGDATSALLYTINSNDSTLLAQNDEADVLLSLAKAVASGAASLVLRAKEVASAMHSNQEAQNAIIGAATQCALATSQMVATAKIVAPTIYDPACQRQLIDASREVARVVRHIGAECRAHRASPQQVRQVDEASERVELALDELLAHVQSLANQTNVAPQQRTVNKIMNVSERLIQTNQNSDQNEMIRQAQLLARATDQLIEHIKHDTSQHVHDSETERRLMGAAKQLTSATERLIEAAKGCASCPHDVEHRQELRAAAQQVAATAASTYADETFVRSSNTRTFTTNESLLSDDVLLHQRQQRQQIEQQDQQRHQPQPPPQQHQYYDDAHGQQQQQSIGRQQQNNTSTRPDTTISGIIGDLETTIMFATAGTLRDMNDGTPFGAHRDHILRTAKALVDNTKTLVANAAGDEASLARAAHDAVDTIARLAERVKAGAASLGPSNSQHQVALCRAARDAACSLDDLINATNGALGKHVNDVAMVHVKDTAKVSSLSCIVLGTFRLDHRN
ncbi:Talin-1, partial [Fragariocoptes setiger]